MQGVKRILRTLTEPVPIGITSDTILGDRTVIRSSSETPTIVDTSADRFFDAERSLSKSLTVQDAVVSMKFRRRMLVESIQALDIISISASFI